MADAIIVRGLSEVLRACAKADKETKKKVRARFRAVGQIVRKDSAARISPLSTRTARGYRVYVRQRGVEVEQTLRKTTGNRGDWGDLQMKRGLIPAAEENREEIRRELEQALEDLADMFPT